MQAEVNMKLKLLYISLLAPYDTVDHAGGKVHNYYLKQLNASGCFDITLLSMCWQREKSKLDLDAYGIPNRIYVLDKNKAHKILRKVISSISYFNPFDKYANMLLDYERYHYKKLIRNYAMEISGKGLKKPDIIILQWTQMVFLIDYVKKYFPSSKIIAIEEDVSFLNFFRRINLCKTGLQKKIAKYRYVKIKKIELEVLKKSDIIVNNNHKDLLLLQNEGISAEKLRELPIYFNSYDYVKRTNINRNILFYGAMARRENYESAIWFIENVMPLLKDEKVNFVVVGSRPHKSLLAKQSKNVVITGYVEYVESYLEHSLCLVAPLVLGAGIKVKILEAMSSGIPVLTNTIGIEGIYAKDGIHFDLCVTPEDYVCAIKKIITYNFVENKEAKKFVKENYDLASAFEMFMKRDLLYSQ